MLICPNVSSALNNAFEALDSPTKKKIKKNVHANVALENVSKFSGADPGCGLGG